MEPRQYHPTTWHLAVLWAFAVAQPVLDLVGREPAFLVARDLSATDLLVLVGLLCFGLPGLLVLGHRWLFNRREQQVVHAVLLGLLAAAALLPAVKHWGILSAGIQVLAALSAGAGFVALYRRRPAVRTLVSYLAPGLLVFPGLFLTQPGVWRAVAAPPPVPPETRAARPVPVVMVVFDELPLFSLLGTDGRIDAGRFPHFAALAREATWYRQATTVQTETAFAVPALLTGRYPDPQKLTTLADHPHNLFALLAATHELRVSESITRLCPPGRNALEPAPSWPARWGGLGADLGLIYLHQLLPREWAAGLPPVNQGWKDFATCPCGAGLAWCDHRPRQVADFVAALEPTPRPLLAYLHVLLPHAPFLFLPSGRRYGGGTGLEALEAPASHWAADAEAVWLAQQRHLLQVGYADRLLGQVLERLRATGLYDAAALVVVADHGVSFRPGHGYRELSATTAAEVLRVPLFVKLPGQHSGGPVELNAQTIDVLPTLAALQGLNLPGPVDGISLLDATAGRPQKRAWGKDCAMTFGPVLGDESGLVRQHARFGVGSWEALHGGPCPAFLGRRVEEAAVEPIPVAVELDTPRNVLTVSAETPCFPAFLRGRVTVPEGWPTPLTLAVAVNGVIHTTTTTAGTWAVMLPEEALEPGDNRVTVFVVEGDRLRRPRQGADQPHYTLVESGGTAALATPDGRRIPIRPRALRGTLDRVTTFGGYVELVGWAAEAKEARPPEALVILKDGAGFWAGPPNLDRPDVAAALGRPGLGRVGFRRRFPVEQLPDPRPPGLRVFAVSAKGEASELTYPALPRDGNHP